MSIDDPLPPEQMVGVLQDTVHEHRGRVVSTRPIKAQPDDWASIEDYKVTIDDYRRLTRELDIALNGNNAAEQASLCDIVAQVKATKRESINFGALAAHVASGLGALKGYGHESTAAAKSLQHVMDELMKLYEQGRRG